MPTVKKGEKQSEWMSRCIPICIGEGLTSEQAKGKCYGMWKEAQNSDRGGEDTTVTRLPPGSSGGASGRSAEEKRKPLGLASIDKVTGKPIFVVRCCKYVEGVGFKPDDARYFCNNIWEECIDDYLPGGQDGFVPPDPNQDGEPDWRIDPKKLPGNNPDTGGRGTQYQGETRQEFIRKCMSHKISQGVNPLEAENKCNDIWEKEYDQPGSDLPLDKQTGGNAGGSKSGGKYSMQPGRSLICLSCENIQPLINTSIDFNDNGKTGVISFNAENKDDFRATCVIGDKFYKGKYLPYQELQKSMKSLDGSYHDINHWGTTYLDGNPNIEYIVGYQDNVKLDPISKALTADIHILRSAEKYQLWRGFVDINQRINKTPNVSVSFFSSKKNMKAKDIPGINLAAHGYKDDDTIEYLYDLEFQALSTVFKGACSDKDGCGIQNQDDKKTYDSIHRLAVNKICNDKECVDNTKRKNLEDKINRIKRKE